MNHPELEQNKATIAHFDMLCIEQNNLEALDQMLLDTVVNHAAPQGAQQGKGSFHHFLEALHSGLSGIKTEILRQVAEGDLVVTHKMISGTHSGNFFGKPATGKPINIEAIEIIRLQNGKYAEHWVQSNMHTILQSL